MPMYNNIFVMNSTHTGVESLIMCALVCHFETFLHNRKCDKFVFTKEDKTCEVVTLTRYYVMRYLDSWLLDSEAFDTHSKRLYGEDESKEMLIVIIWKKYLKFLCIYIGEEEVVAALDYAHSSYKDAIGSSTQAGPFEISEGMRNDT